MSTTESRPSAKRDITRPITFWILGAYVVLVLSFVLKNFSEGANTRWFESAKTGFTTLGSSPTLILGYYFGQTPGAELARKGGERELEKVKKEKVGLERALRDEIHGLTHFAASLVCWHSLEGNA